MKLSGLLAENRLKKGTNGSLVINKFLEPRGKNFCTEIQKGRTGWPKYLEVQQSNAKQGKITEYLILDCNNKELVRGNKININQIKSMENRFCPTKLTTFLMRLQIRPINSKNAIKSTLIYLVFSKGLDLVRLIN